MKHSDSDNIAAWDRMILDARKKILDLQYSIENFERRKTAGEPCPAIEQIKLPPRDPQILETGRKVGIGGARLDLMSRFRKRKP